MLNKSNRQEAFGSLKKSWKVISSHGGDAGKDENNDDNNDDNDDNNDDNNDEPNSDEDDGKVKTKSGVHDNIEKKYTDADVQKIIDKALAKERRREEKKATEAEKLAGMNEAQKEAYERQKLQERIDELERKESLNGLKSEARKMLEAEGFSVPDALISLIIGSDADETKESVEAFSELLKEEIKKAVTESLKRKTPKGTEQQQSQALTDAQKAAQKINAKYQKPKEG